MKRIAAALAALLLFGGVKFQMEQAIDQAHRNAYFRGAHLNLSLREQIGQGAFLAALSGFRGVIADILSLEANEAWQNTQWSRVIMLYNQITTLAPRMVLHWEMAANYMAFDASVSVLEDPRQPRQALRVKASREYIQVGRDFLERGIRNNPDRHALYSRLGFLLMEKLKDHQGAYEAYTQASKFPDALGYEERFAAYELSKCPGKEAQAYALLVEIYRRGKREQTPTLLHRIRALEEKLNISSEQRVYIPAGTPP
jgi:hypothetical protein